MRKIRLLAAATGVALAATTATGSALAQAGTHAADGSNPLGKFKHLVVIYQENHSFDNLYGGWGSVNGQPVDGIGGAGYDSREAQVREDGTTFTCLLQNDPQLTTPPMDGACGTDSGPNATFTSHFTNQPFQLNPYVSPTGNTGDLVHRFYQEQYQLDGGKMDRYSTGSDAAGLTQGYWDTRKLPIYQYLHSNGAPPYVVADRFFQSVFGGSFANHQYLIAAQVPVWPNAPASKHSVVDAQGFPNPNLPNASGVRAYPLKSSNSTLVDGPVTQACGTATTQPGFACGDYAINTVQPSNPPSAGGSNTLPLINDVDPTMPNYETNIGDELSASNVSWAWYAGGWNDAVAGHPDPLFQYHHQPFNYFANYATSMPGRSHLKDETEFMTAAQNGTLPSVSFVKPIGENNEHPGYANVDSGEGHLVDLIKAVESGPQAGNTLIVVTYDEFGGSWDHVVPPGQGSAGVAGPYDEYGPGTRIPALLIARSFTRSGVDSTEYDTTSILATIEHAWGLAPLDSRFHRDSQVSDLRPAIAIGRKS
jgi:acid phosphatase